MKNNTKWFWSTLALMVFLIVGIACCGNSEPVAERAPTPTPPLVVLYDYDDWSRDTFGSIVDKLTILQDPVTHTRYLIIATGGSPNRPQLIKMD